MIFEQIILLILAICAICFIGIPSYKLIKELTPKKQNPLLNAKIRLEVAKNEIEAAKLDKETEKIYNSLYEEVLNQDEESDKRNNVK